MTIALWKEITNLHASTELSCPVYPGLDQGMVYNRPYETLVEWQSIVDNHPMVALRLLADQVPRYEASLGLKGEIVFNEYP